MGERGCLAYLISAYVEFRRLCGSSQRCTRACSRMFVCLRVLVPSISSQDRLVGMVTSPYLPCGTVVGILTRDCCASSHAQSAVIAWVRVRAW